MVTTMTDSGKNLDSKQHFGLHCEMNSFQDNPSKLGKVK